MSGKVFGAPEPPGGLGSISLLRSMLRTKRADRAVQAIDELPPWSFHLSRPAGLAVARHEKNT